jgi:hypothetical protein
MTLYDPGWRRFEPTEEEFLAGVARDRDARGHSKGFKKAVEWLPWPVRVVVPVVAGLCTPVLVLALLFGAAPGGNPGLRTRVHVHNSGAQVAIKDPDFEITPFEGESLGRHQVEITVVNTSKADFDISADAALVRGDLAGGSDPKVEIAPAKASLAAGQEVSLSLSLIRDSADQRGDYEIVLNVTANGR